MVRRRFVRRADEWAEVARWLGVFWACRCRYHNAASYRCYFCGGRAPNEVRALVARTLHAADSIGAVSTRRARKAGRACRGTGVSDTPARAAGDLTVASLD